MKEYRIDTFGIDELSLVNVDMPAVKAGEVLVRLRATSINYRDVMMVEGGYNPRMPLPRVP